VYVVVAVRQGVRRSTLNRFDYHEHRSTPCY
jgi:hypothetical protein